MIYGHAYKQMNTGFNFKKLCEILKYLTNHTVIPIQINSAFNLSLAQYGQQELLKQHENLEWKYIRKGKYNMNKNLE